MTTILLHRTGASAPRADAPDDGGAALNATPVSDAPAREMPGHDRPGKTPSPLEPGRRTIEPLRGAEPDNQQTGQTPQPPYRNPRYAPSGLQANPDKPESLAAAVSGHHVSAYVQCDDVGHAAVHLGRDGDDDHRQQPDHVVAT